VAGRIAGIAGLDGNDRLMKPDTADAPPSPAFVNAPPCSTSWAQTLAVDGDGHPTVPPAYGQTGLPYATCGYTPSQLQGAYGTKSTIAGGVDGRGQTVAIVDAFAAPTIEQDANQYAGLHGQPTVSFHQILPPHDLSNDPDEIKLCDPQGWYGEETLDVEAVHAMAPGANVLYVGSDDCFDENLVDAVNKIVDGGLAQIITNSYGNAGETGEDAGLRQAWNDTFRQAALEGIGVYFSSGDSGDEVDDLGQPEPDFPASHPLVTAVGGTSLGVSANDG
jgi:subtilase family serine protease